MASSVMFPSTSVAVATRWPLTQLKVSPKFCVRSSLDTDVSDMSTNGKVVYFVFYSGYVEVNYGFFWLVWYLGIFYFLFLGYCFSY